LFLQVQQVETAQLPFKLSLPLCNIPQDKSVQSVHNLDGI